MQFGLMYLFSGFGDVPQAQIFNEFPDMLLGTFSQDNCTHAGKFWSCNDVTLFPKPVQQPQPPIYMAAVSPPPCEQAPGKDINAGYELHDAIRKAHARVTYDDLADWGSAFGDPESVAQRILTYARQGGTNHWMAEMRFGGLGHEQTMRSMKLFVTEVMPRVREARAKDAAA